MSTKYKIRDQDRLYFITFSVVYWIDVFTRGIAGYYDYWVVGILNTGTKFQIPERHGTKFRARERFTSMVGIQRQTAI